MEKRVRPNYLRDIKEETKLMNEFALLLNYDHRTGVFTWKKRMSQMTKAGDVAGTEAKKDEYISIITKGKKIKAHRLAWFIHYGKVPDFCIDHVNGNKSDNRISNLRDVTEIENQSNRKCHRNKTLWGAHKKTGRKNFAAKVHRKHLGVFATAEEAHAVAVEYARKHNIKVLNDRTGG